VRVGRADGRRGGWKRKQDVKRKNHTAERGRGRAVTDVPDGKSDGVVQEILDADRTEGLEQM